MPITLKPVSRRGFMTGSLAVATGLLLRDRASAVDTAKRDPNRFALLSDIHIDADPKRISREVNMSDHLKIAIDQVLALDGEQGPPGNLIINGDCAYSSGEVGDYEQMLKLLAPASAAGLPIHLSMGNHDSRERFYASVPHEKIGAGAAMQAVEKKHVLLIETPLADWIVLDSMIKTNTTPGEIGAAQLKWLTQTLDHPKRANKPVMVAMHHNPVVAPINAVTTQPATNPSTKPAAPATTTPRDASRTTQPTTQPLPKGFAGNIDTRELLDVLVPRKQVKALFYGHSHVWATEKHDGLHWVNLPAVAYVFRATQSSGWIDCRVSERGMRLAMRTIKPDAPHVNDVRTLEWR